MAPLGRRPKKPQPSQQQQQQQPSSPSSSSSPSAPAPTRKSSKSRIGFPSVLALSAASVSATAIPPTLSCASVEGTGARTPPPERIGNRSGNGSGGSGRSSRNTTPPPPPLPRLATTGSGEAVTGTTVEWAAGERAMGKGDAVKDGKKDGENSLRDVSPATSVRTLPLPTTASVDGATRKRIMTESTAPAAPGKRSSWFSRKGTWPRSGVSTTKSPAVTDVAMENASGESLPTAESDVGKENTAPSAPLSTETVTLPEPTPQQQEIAEAVMQTPKASADQGAVTADATETTPATSEATTEPLKPDVDTDAEAKPKPNPRTSWVEWWYGQPAQAEPVTGDGNGDADEQKPQATEIHVSTTSTPAATTDEPAKEDTESSTPSEPTQNEQKMDDDTTSRSGKTDPDDAKREEAKQVAARKGWFGFWGGGAQDPAAVEEEGKQQEEVLPEETQQAHVPEQVAEQVAESAVEEAQKPAVEEQTGTAPPVRSSGYGLGWFWSQKEEAPTATPETKPPVEEGEIAVVTDNSKPPPPPQKALIKLPDVVKPLKGSTSTPTLREDAAQAKPKAPGPPKSQPPAPSPLKAEQNASTTSLPPSLPSEDSSAQKKLQKILPKNHLLPTFESCYTFPEHPSLLQQLVKYSPIPSFLRPAPPPPANHLSLTRTPPKIHKAVAIGVHGFFPMRLVRTVLGEPTGTSKRFANHAASSIRRWADANNLPVEIETIALEGEGKVADRVAVLWKLLQNWISAVRAADFIVIAAHSQGVPVGMQILAKMIDEGVVANATRIAFIGMAGINLGPFGHLPTAMLTGSAKELFEFQKQNSQPSQNYYAALEKVIRHNVTRICFVGSIDDQLVPLESSTMTNISHPYIFRAVFVDGRLHTPDFLSHLVGFAMKLRNLGVSDHGLIRELSSPLAGSLYGGEGHSRIYDDGCVYDLGIRHALETTSLATPSATPLVIAPFELPTNANPFYLPWSMRGLLEETFVRTRLQKECWELLELFEQWKPQTKQLRDVKFRLEAVRSKL